MIFLRFKKEGTAVSTKEPWGTLISLMNFIRIWMNPFSSRANCCCKLNFWRKSLLSELYFMKFSQNLRFPALKLPQTKINPIFCSREVNNAGFSFVSISYLYIVNRRSFFEFKIINCLLSKYSIKMVSFKIWFLSKNAGLLSFCLRISFFAKG